ncbi:hypothetical protein BFJ68_g11050 [Fusarium oxysporum]|uniref:Uncharacterized protein n=1 Tax=Fusarium oxysporum TaxID=5507 RepID=A0A420QI10_FUSOX|nr:hypothetical protein BFJ66_g9308 [Fusarium oxysporum f. sp. cepae]RKL04448.1 hypothetical protein BFJ68_g11050 [Fusarium oxysporum]
MCHIENRITKCDWCHHEIDAESPKIDCDDVLNGRPCKGVKKERVTNIKHVDRENCAKCPPPESEEPDEPDQPAA